MGSGLSCLGRVKVADQEAGAGHVSGARAPGVDSGGRGSPASRAGGLQPRGSPGSLRPQSLQAAVAARTVSKWPCAPKRMGVTGLSISPKQ